MAKVPDESSPWGWGIKAAVIGEGDVDLDACVKVLSEAGYDGFVALEYEGDEDEKTGVPKSVETLKRVVG
jgi:sugar phosphate isomerase/epimerase